MGLSKTEVNLRRLLAAAPKQQNQAKLIHYITTLRELLEQLGAETASEGISSISKAKLNEYSEKIEALATNLASPLTEAAEAADRTSLEETTLRTEQGSNRVNSPPQLRRRHMSRTENEVITHAESESAAAVKLDASAQAHIEKHRQLQEDLTDEMVVLARQLKESSLMMNQSLNDTEKITWFILHCSSCSTLTKLTWSTSGSPRKSKHTLFHPIGCLDMTFGDGLMAQLLRVEKKRT